MNDILFGNNNTKTIKRLSKQYFKKNKVRNLAAILAIVLTAFLFTSITSLAFNMVSSMQLSMQMQKGSKGDGTFGYMTEEQFEQLKNSDFVEQAGHRRTIGYASNAVGHSVELNYADSIQQELTFCVPTHGSAPEKANEIATTELALKALGVEPEIGAEVPLEFELRGKTYHYDMVLSGWWEASNDTVSVAILSEQFVKDNPDVVKNTHAVDSTASLQASASPMLFVIAALFTILTVFISTRKPAKKASKVSPMEAIRYTEQDDYKKKTVTRISGAKLSHMAFSNLGRNRRRCVFIVVSMLLCIVLFNSIIIVTQSMDEEKWITRTTKTDFTVYNSIAVNVQEGFRHHEDALPQQVVDMIREQNGLEEERYLYRNTVDDGNVLVDYGFEGLTCTNTFEYENGISKSFGNYALNTAPDAENLFFGNVYGASEHFWSDMMIYDGETDPNVLKQKMLTGEYVIIGNRLDRLSGGPKTTSLSEQLQIGDSISFYRDGELVKTCTILAKACTVGTEDETPTTTTATMHIGGDAPFVYLPDTVFKQIYTTPTLLNYGFNMDASLHPQMEDFLSSYVEKNPSVTYTSTKLLKEQLNSVASMVWVVGSLIGCIMALAGLINFTNMIITNIITRRHEFATMQSIGMTNRQLQRLMVYEGVYYAAGADIIGGVVALLLAVTVLKNVLNSPSMWFFTLHITLVPALVIGVLYLLLAAVIPLIVLHFFNKGTVVERLRTSE